jgi:hypothetical protein
MTNLENLGLDTKQSNNVERKTVRNSVNSGGVVKKVPGRKRSFAAKNREQVGKKTLIQS